MTSITFHPALAESSHRFSIVIPTWNNLPHLQLLVRSIREHSRYQHQIVVHVNEGSDGTRQWVEQQNFSYSYSEKNVGVCFAFNAAASLAKSDFLLLIDDDNCCPTGIFTFGRKSKKLDILTFQCQPPR